MDTRDLWLRHQIDVLTGLDQWFEPIPTSRERTGSPSTRLRILRRNGFIRLLEALLPEHVSLARKVDRRARDRGLDWPEHALTMVGRQRLSQLRSAVEAVVADDVPGDIMETGVWRGGSSILALLVLLSLSDDDRRVILADSFEGLPPPGFSGDDRDELDLSFYRGLAVPRHQVEKNFRSFGLPLDRVVFLEGWFHETLPSFNPGPLAVLRLDGDLYSSTRIALESLYSNVSPGGFLIVDDWQIPECRRAVLEFRGELSIRDEIIDIDGQGVYWRKT